LKKKMIGLISLVVFSTLLSVPLVFASPPPQAKGPPAHIDEPEAVIYVTSQGMYYHTIVPYAGGSLPYNGHNGASFQPINPNPNPAETPYGPGDPGYRGGRWWVDVNGNGEMDPEGEGGDHYFLCPLLGPGTPVPT
jgi:hypothetical protein